jgi:drug/metabolite transporter (DMT)-like permease
VEVDGVLLATCGMALMTLPGATLAMNRGDLLTVCCAACYSAHILTLNRYSAKASFELLATAQIGISALLAFSLFRGMETPYIRWTPGVWAAILITGVFATARAFTFQTWAQRYTTSTRAAPAPRSSSCSSRCLPGLLPAYSPARLSPRGPPPVLA